VSKDKIVARTMLHSSYIAVTEMDGDALVISEIVERESGEITPSLRVLKNPEVRFWVTAPEFRNHTDKKEFEHQSKLKCITVPFKHREREMFRELNGYTPNFMGRKQRQAVLESPFIYGGNITLPAFAAMKYKDDLQKVGRINHTFTTGFLDIERSLLPESEGRLPIITVTVGSKVFTAVKKSFMWEIQDGKHVPVTIDLIKRKVAEHVEPLIARIFDENKKSVGRYADQLPFTFHYFEGDHEVDMIRWIFDRIHETKVSFMGVWNINFDIPEILKVLRENNVRYEDILVAPELRGTPFAQVRYKEDTKKTHHFTQKWHWLTASAHFQFVDSTSLYSYVRTVEGKEPSYALDDIATKYNLGGKLKLPDTAEFDSLQTADWHRAMLSQKMSSYVVYGMWDTIVLQLLEWRNNDFTSMVLGADITPVECFPRQTVKATNVLFDSWKKKGYILGTGVNVEGVADEKLLNEGGAVLEPGNLVAAGAKLFKDWPNHNTRCFFWGNDLDFSAQYPTNTIVANISKQTKVATILSVRGPHVQKYYSEEDAIEVLCSYQITPESNGMELGTEFLGLPGFAEVNALFKEFLSTKSQ
jgi:hypothetical protein